MKRQIFAPPEAPDVHGLRRAKGCMPVYAAGKLGSQGEVASKEDPGECRLLGATMTTFTGQMEPLQLLADAAAVIDEGLEDALSMLRADRGNVQIVDPASGSLRIAAQAGFSDEFLEYFAAVDDDGSACGRAARHLAQTVIVDVNTDPSFAPHREIAAAAGFRAVNSTPLVDLRGHLVGVISTHYPRPYCPPDADLELMKRLGELIGQAIEACLEADGQAASLRFGELIEHRPLGRRTWRPMARHTRESATA